MRRLVDSHLSWNRLLLAAHPLRLVSTDMQRISEAVDGSITSSSSALEHPPPTVSGSDHHHHLVRSPSSFALRNAENSQEFQQPMKGSMEFSNDVARSRLPKVNLPNPSFRHMSQVLSDKLGQLRYRRIHVFNSTRTMMAEQDCVDRVDWAFTMSLFDKMPTTMLGRNLAQKLDSLTSHANGQLLITYDEWSRSPSLRDEFISDEEATRLTASQNLFYTELYQRLPLLEEGLRGSGVDGGGVGLPRPRLACLVKLLTIFRQMALAPPVKQTDAPAQQCSGAAMDGTVHYAAATKKRVHALIAQVLLEIDDQLQEAIVQRRDTMSPREVANTELMMRDVGLAVQWFGPSWMQQAGFGHDGDNEESARCADGVQLLPVLRAVVGAMRCASPAAAVASSSTIEK